MYQHLLCRNRVSLGPFGSPALFSTFQRPQNAIWACRL